MTTIEKEQFFSLKRKLQQDPVRAMNFYAQWADKLDVFQLSVMDKWDADGENRDRAICKYLGIEYNKDDLTISDNQIAEEWANSLPDRTY